MAAQSDVFNLAESSREADKKPKNYLESEIMTTDGADLTPLANTGAGGPRLNCAD